PSSVIACDLNGDGKLDLAVANVNSNTVSVLLNTTAPGAVTPSFAPKQDIPTGEGPLSVVASDFNGDAKIDLVVSNLASTFSILANNTTTGATTVAFAAKRDFAAGDGSRFV